MVFLVDIDDTLILSIKSKCPTCHRPTYSNAKPIQKEIDRVNRLYRLGHTIILYTGRNWDTYKLTKKQMKDFGVLHHELVMGKPQGMIIDDLSCTSLQKFVKEEVSV
jgi:hypothetical protein